MQDDAPVHIGRNVRTWMQRYFEEREIGHYATSTGQHTALTSPHGFLRLVLGQEARFSPANQHSFRIERAHLEDDARDASGFRRTQPPEFQEPSPNLYREKKSCRIMKICNFALFIKLQTLFGNF